MSRASKRLSEQDKVEKFSHLLSLGDEIHEINAEIKVREDRKKELMLEASTLAEALGTSKVPGEGWTMFKSSRTSIRYSPEKLAEKGVPMKVIEYAREETVSEFWQVRSTKEPKS